MHKSFLKSFVLAVVSALALTLLPSASAQLVSAGMTGTVRGNDGNAIAGATVTALHTPTNASYTATTNTVGRFNFRGLPVGGPYTLTTRAQGFDEVATTDIVLELGNDIDIGVTLKSEVLKLEKFVVGGSRNDLDSSASGAGTVLNSQRLAGKPTAERSFADMISANPLVTLNSLSSANDHDMIADPASARTLVSTMRSSSERPIASSRRARTVNARSLVRRRDRWSHR